jgi:hypothetical protein
MLAMAPAQQGQQPHHDIGKDACASTMATTPWQQGWWHQLDNRNNFIATRATILLQWRQRCLDRKDACALTMVTPSQQGQWGQLDNSKDACALMTGMTPLLQGQRCQLDDYALNTAETPLQGAQQLPPWQWQRCLCINSNNAIATRATMPLQWQQGHLRIDDDNDTILTRARTPTWGWQKCHSNKDNNAIPDQGWQHHCYEVNNARSTMERMPAHQQWQQCHHHEGNNHNRNNCKDTCTLTATMPSQQGQQHQLDNQQQGQQR